MYISGLVTITQALLSLGSDGHVFCPKILLLVFPLFNMLFFVILQWSGNPIIIESLTKMEHSNFIALKTIIIFTRRSNIFFSNKDIRSVSKEYLVHPAKYLD